MTTTQKFIAGFVLGFIGYCAYKKLKQTKTVTVDTFQTPVPSVLDVSTIAGMRR